MTVELVGEEQARLAVKDAQMLVVVRRERPR
jgi:hypothetical protein